MRWPCRSTPRRSSTTRCGWPRARARRKSGGRLSNSRRRSSTPSRHGHLSLPASATVGTRDSDAIPPPASPSRRRPPSLGPSGTGARAGRTPSRPPSHAPVLSRAPSLEVVRSCARWPTFHEIILAAMGLTPAFARPAALGDLIAALLALGALAAVRRRDEAGRLLVWIFNVEGSLDLLVA